MRGSDAAEQKLRAHVESSRSEMRTLCAASGDEKSVPRVLLQVVNETFRDIR